MSYPPYQPPPPVKQRRSVNTIVLLIVGFFGTLFIGMGIGFAAAKSSDTTLVADPAPVVTKTERVSTLITVGPTPPATTAPAVAPKPTAAKATIPDGYQVVVGVDAPAGVYEAHSTSSDCYWEIDRHGTSDIVNNDAGKLGHLVITLKKGQDFSSHDCGDWTKQ